MQIPVMTYRIISSTDTILGYQHSGVRLVEYNDGAFLPSGVRDDVGFYYFIPGIADLFNVSAMQAFNIFFLAILAFSLLCGLAGTILYIRSHVCKLISALYLCVLGFILLKTGDVYIAYFSSITTLALLFLYFTGKEKLGTLFYVFTFLSFLYLGILHYVRFNSGAGVVLFVAVLVLLHRTGIAKKALFVFHAS